MPLELRTQLISSSGFAPAPSRLWLLLIGTNTSKSCPLASGRKPTPTAPCVPVNDAPTCAGQYLPVAVLPLSNVNDQSPPVSSTNVPALRGWPKQRIGALVSTEVPRGSTTSVPTNDDPGPHGLPGIEIRTWA